jgi:hypothetical protein
MENNFELFLVVLNNNVIDQGFKSVTLVMNTNLMLLFILYNLIQFFKVVNLPSFLASKWLGPL